jgi:hypothetical protein
MYARILGKCTIEHIPQTPIIIENAEAVQRCVFPLSTFLHIVVILYVVSFQMNKYLYFTVIPSIECVDPGSIFERNDVTRNSIIRIS